VIHVTDVTNRDTFGDAYMLIMHKESRGRRLCAITISTVYRHRLNAIKEAGAQTSAFCNLERSAQLFENYNDYKQLESWEQSSVSYGLRVIGHIPNIYSVVLRYAQR
jgi:hypothetical protein